MDKGGRAAVKHHVVEHDLTGNRPLRYGQVQLHFCSFGWRSVATRNNFTSYCDSVVCHSPALAGSSTGRRNPSTAAFRSRCGVGV